MARPLCLRVSMRARCLRPGWPCCFPVQRRPGLPGRRSAPCENWERRQVLLWLQTAPGTEEDRPVGGSGGGGRRGRRSSMRASSGSCRCEPVAGGRGPSESQCGEQCRKQPEIWGSGPSSRDPACSLGGQLGAQWLAPGIFRLPGLWSEMAVPVGVRQPRRFPSPHPARR